MWKILVMLISEIVLIIVSAIAHENDIVRECEKHGNPGSAMWVHKIECKVIE